jgi:alpha-L-rhamnosidase
MRYVEIGVLSGEMEVSRPRLRSYKNPTAKRAQFRASDSDLEKIFVAAKETFRQNAVDVYTDCPGRERAGWNCDAYFTSKVSTLLTGNTDLETAYEHLFALPNEFDFLPEGMLPMCYPADHPKGGFIPNWAMWFVIETEEYLKRSGDRGTVDALKPRFEKLVEFFYGLRNSDGLLENLPSWVFVEWSFANRLTQDVNYPSNMLWAGMLDAMARLYVRKDLAEEAARVRETIRRQSWTGEWFCDNAVRGKDGTLKLSGECTETCQYYAFFFNVADPKSHGDLYKRLLTSFGPGRKKTKLYPKIHFSNAFIGNYLRLCLLARENRGAQILNETKGYFKKMADMTGTLWEHDNTSASCNHGFASYATVFLIENVLGVTNVDLQNKTVTLCETDVDLEWCEADLPVGSEMMHIGWRRTADGRKWDIKLPKEWKSVYR